MPSARKYPDPLNYLYRGESYSEKEKTLLKELELGECILGHHSVVC